MRLARVMLSVSTLRLASRWTRSSRVSSTRSVCSETALPPAQALHPTFCCVTSCSRQGKWAEPVAPAPVWTDRRTTCRGSTRQNMIGLDVITLYDLAPYVECEARLAAVPYVSMSCLTLTQLLFRDSSNTLLNDCLNFNNRLSVLSWFKAMRPQK